MLTPAVETLVTQRHELPAIGRRTAQRLTFHLLSAKPEGALELARAIEDVKTRVRFCRECGNLIEEELCPILQRRPTGPLLDLRRRRRPTHARRRIPAGSRSTSWRSSSMS